MNTEENMTKKIVFICLIMVILFASLCFADTKISEIMIAGGDKPSEGKTASYSWSVHTFDDKKF